MSLLNYTLTLVITGSIYVMVGLSLNFMSGYCGRLTLTHGGLYGAGAYAYALVALKGEFWVFPYLGFLTAALVGALLGLVLALPERRLRGDFFIIGTLALQAILFSLFRNWQTPGEPIGSWKNLTNGTVGIPGVPRPVPFDGSLMSLALFSVLLTLAVVSVGVVLLRSPWGRLLRASRDDRLVAEGLGKPVRRARAEAFALSGATAAVAGSLYAAYARYISPDLGSVDVSVLFLSMVLIGGLGTVRGPLVGAVVFLFLEEVLRVLKVADFLKDQASFLANSGFTDANLQLLVYGLLLVILLRARPHGLAGDPGVFGGR